MAKIQLLQEYPKVVIPSKETLAEPWSQHLSNPLRPNEKIIVKEVEQPTSTMILVVVKRAGRLEKFQYNNFTDIQGRPFKIKAGKLWLKLN